MPNKLLIIYTAPSWDVSVLYKSHPNTAVVTRVIAHQLRVAVN